MIRRENAGPPLEFELGPMSAMDGTAVIPDLNDSTTTMVLDGMLHSFLPMRHSARYAPNAFVVVFDDSLDAALRYAGHVVWPIVHRLAGLGHGRGRDDVVGTVRLAGCEPDTGLNIHIALGESAPTPGQLQERVDNLLAEFTSATNAPYGLGVLFGLAVSAALSTRRIEPAYHVLCTDERTVRYSVVDGSIVLG